MEPQALRATELRYCTETGDEVVTDLAGADASLIVVGAPVREFAWRPHQGHYPGWLWTATTRSLVGYESLLERDRVLLGDFEPSVTAIASQPFWVCGRDGSELRRHAPDYLLQRRDGSFVVVDVKPARMCREPKVAAVLDWSGRICAARGWRYEVFHGEDPTVLSNLRFLAIGRRLEFLEPGCVGALERVRVDGMTLAQAEAQVAGFDPLDVRAATLSLLWRQVWVTDLSRPLSSRSVLKTPGGEEQSCPVAS